MKDIGIIKWILNLGERDRTLAIVLVATSGLWTQNLIDKMQYNQLQDRYRIEMIRTKDSCDAQKERLTQIEYDRIIKTQNLVDSLARQNLFIISNNNKHITIVKKGK